jgi:hypothetical protein
MNDTRGLYDLRDVQVKEVGSYWLEITGVPGRGPRHVFFLRKPRGYHLGRAGGWQGPRTGRANCAC